VEASLPGELALRSTFETISLFLSPPTNFSSLVLTFPPHLLFRSTILTLQSGRSLVASYADALKGIHIPAGMGYLNSLPSILTESCTSDDSILELDTLQKSWDVVSANVVKMAHDAFEKARKSGLGKEEALEICSQERFVAAKIHTSGYLLRYVVVVSSVLLVLPLPLY
jgi:hypothetical protein